MQPAVVITLIEQPTEQELAILRLYLSDARHLSSDEWRTLRSGIDRLAQCMVDFSGRTYTFREFYATFVNGTYARPFLAQLGQLRDLEKEGAALQATVARKILTWLRANGIVAAAVQNAEFLIIYTLYWWAAFARGYLFEQIVFRDLGRSGIRYQAHEVETGPGRYTRYDLVIPELGNGDVKASLYFLDHLREPTADFYITQLYDSKQQRLRLTVFLYPEGWKRLNGTPLPATISTAPQLFPQPVLVVILSKPWVMVEYEYWKVRLLDRQLRGESNGR